MASSRESSRMDLIPPLPSGAPATDQTASMVADYLRTQAIYTQTRYFTPGVQTTDVRTTHGGESQEMDLLVVVHNDAPGAPGGGQRVDVQVNVDSGAYENAHLVNAYDSGTGVTDHTAVYAQEDLSAISEASGRASHRLEDMTFKQGRVPGAMIHSVTARVKTVDGSLVIDTDHPMTRGPLASRYSLHDQQQAMDSAAWANGNTSVSYALHNPQEPAAAEPVAAPAAVPAPSGRLGRLRRFPELRGMRASAGNAARFPELVAEAEGTGAAVETDMGPGR